MPRLRLGLFAFDFFGLKPKGLRKLRLDKNHWTMKVKAVGSRYWRVVGELEELIDKAKELKQRTLFGIGFARDVARSAG